MDKIIHLLNWIHGQPKVMSLPFNIKGDSLLHPLLRPYYTFNNPNFDKLFMIQIHHLWQWFVLLHICIITSLQTIPLNKKHTYKREVCNLLLNPSLGYIKLNVFVYRFHTTTNVQGVIFVRCLRYLRIQSCSQSFYLFSLHNIDLQWIMPLGTTWGSSCHSINVFKNF
jgi:hypothetical protein